MPDAMSDEWFSPFSLSEPLVERRAKRELKKMNAWASAIQGKKLGGERIANLEKMSECPAHTAIPPRFVAPIDCFKIPASVTSCLRKKAKLKTIALLWSPKASFGYCFRVQETFFDLWKFPGGKKSLNSYTPPQPPTTSPTYPVLYVVICLSGVPIHMTYLHFNLVLDYKRITISVAFNRRSFFEGY